MRFVACIVIVIALGSCVEDVYFIPGTGTLPDCDDVPVTDLDGTLWFNEGPVTIRTEGCLDTAPGEMFMSCAENWAFTQDGNDLSIVVDEYQINGRMCGDELHLEGGWWISVQDEEGACWYEDDDGDEMGIQSDGNILVIDQANQQMTGKLVLEGSCGADYQVTLSPVRDPSL